TELVTLTGLAAGTITDIVNDLVARRLLLEEKSPVLGRGRPRIQLRVNPGAAYVVGAYLAPASSLLVEVVNRKGEVLCEKEVALPAAARIEQLSQTLADAIQDGIRSSPFRLKQIHSVGVGLPAMVDSARGVLHWLVTLPAGDVPIASLLSDRLKLPVFVDNAA